MISKTTTFVIFLLSAVAAASAASTLHSCDFDDGLTYCGWTNDANDDYDWTRRSGSTPTSSTGPSSDHTTGSGYYMYLETLTSSSGYDAVLRTPVFDISTSKTGHCVQFWYNMYGSTMGTLDVYVMHGSTKVSKIFTRSGNQGSNWLTANATITTSYSSYQIAFEATTGGGGYYGDMAIDDVAIYTTSTCEDIDEENTEADAAPGLEDLTECCADNICSFPYNGYGYFLTPVRSWPEARVFCQGLGGDLATLGVRSLSTRQAIADNLGADGDVWIGVNDVTNEGCFRWVDRFDDDDCADDSTMNWRNANTTLTDGDDCVEIRGGHRWEAEDVSCARRQRAICEIVLSQCRGSSYHGVAED